MDVRRTFTALAMPCLCLAAADAAAAQSRSASPVAFGPTVRPILLDLGRAEAVTAEDEFRLQSEERAAARQNGMLRSWELEGDAEIGLGRFTVPNSARPRTHTERLRGGMENETRGIAGAGLRVRF